MTVQKAKTKKMKKKTTPHLISGLGGGDIVDEAFAVFVELRGGQLSAALGSLFGGAPRVRQRARLGGLGARDLHLLISRPHLLPFRKPNPLLPEIPRATAKCQFFRRDFEK